MPYIIKKHTLNEDRKTLNYSYLSRYDNNNDFIFKAIKFKSKKDAVFFVKSLKDRNPYANSRSVFELIEFI